MEADAPGNISLGRDRYVARIREKVYPVYFLQDGSTVQIGERSFRLDIAVVDKGSFSLLLDDASHEIVLVGLAEDNGVKQFGITVNGEPFSVSIEDQRAHIWKVASGGMSAKSSTQNIKAPMPGKVMLVNVNEGQRIDIGHGVCVLEAMKMENEIKSPVVGVVSGLHIWPGKSVEKGEILISIEPG